MSTHDIEKLIEMSDPAHDLTARERTLATRMLSQSMHKTPMRRYSQPIVLGAVITTLLSGGVLTAAAATGVWDLWAQDDALASLHYQLPSGVSCELRVGNFQEAPAEVDEVIRRALANADFDHADVAEAAASVGVQGDTRTDDQAFQTGYNWAVTNRIEEALVAHGLDGKWASFSGQAICE